MNGWVENTKADKSDGHGGGAPEVTLGSSEPRPSVEYMGSVTRGAHGVSDRQGATLHPPQSVRRIPVSTRSITGQLGGQGFESALERDLLMQLAWDEQVAWFVTQPVEINYEFPLKRPRKYTPDVLIVSADPKLTS